MELLGITMELLGIIWNYYGITRKSVGITRNYWELLGIPERSLVIPWFEGELSPGHGISVLVVACRPEAPPQKHAKPKGTPEADTNLLQGPK